MSSIKKNLSLQTIYQILSACMPLITAPYLARKLGVDQLGIFSYTSSIVAYFTLFAMLGTINYGTRCISSVKNDRNKRNEVFSSILILQIVVTIASIIAYVVYLLFFCKENELIAVLQGIALISCLADISWLFFGVEDFQITVTRSIIIKLATVALILLLVKTQDDLWLYTLIMLGGTLLSNLILFLYVPRYASFIKVPVRKIKEHIIPNLVLFVPLLAMSVYHTMDKTMLGALSTYEQSGFYYNSDKIVQIPLLVINGIGTVMLPRMSSLLSEKKQKEADKLFVTTLEGVAAVSIAIACGIAAISNEFVPFFFGPGYDSCIAITIVFSPVLLIKGFSVIVRTQYLIPMEMEKEFTKSVIGGAVVNLIMNFILIPQYGAMGAAIATVIAELVACILQFFSIRGKGLGIKKMLVKTSLYLVIGLLMIAIVRAVALIDMNIVIKLIVEVISGASFFGIVCIAFWKITNNQFFAIICKPIIHKFK